MDEDLPRQIADLLVARGHDTTTVVGQGWQGTLDHYVRDYGGSAERRGKLHFYNMKVDILAPDAAMLIGQYRLERGTRVTEGVNTRLFRKIHGKWLITMNHVSAYDLPASACSKAYRAASVRPLTPIFR